MVSTCPAFFFWSILTRSFIIGVSLLGASLCIVIMFLISVSLTLASLIYYYVNIKGKARDREDGFKSAYFQLALRTLQSLGGESYNSCYCLFNPFHLKCCHHLSSFNKVSQFDRCLSVQFYFLILLAT